MNAIEKLARNAYENAKLAANAVEGEPRYLIPWEHAQPSIRAGWKAAVRYVIKHYPRRRP